MDKEQSNLMLSDEEIRKIFSQIEDVLIDSGLVLNDIMPELRKVAQAELDHLKGLGIVYVKDEYTCDWCNGNKKYKLDSGVETDCLCCSMNGKKYNYISLSDYKGEK